MNLSIIFGIVTSCKHVLIFEIVLKDLK